MTRFQNMTLLASLAFFSACGDDVEYSCYVHCWDYHL